jgi:glutamate dehydrogenase (NAD(P)+)
MAKAGAQRPDPICGLNLRNIQHMSSAPTTKSKPAAKPGKNGAPVKGGKGPKDFDHPIFHELAFQEDPNNLYRQTVGSMLQASDLMGLGHELKIILAQPKNEIIVTSPSHG